MAMYDECYVTYQIHVMHTNARTRAIKKKIPFAITRSSILAALEKTNWRCAVTNTKFEFSNRANNPWQPSLDRINSSGGYVHSNIQLVCLAYNVAKNFWGHDTVIELAEALVEEQNG